MRSANFPFSALTANDELFLAIILNLINPKLGGLMVRGVKDTSINKVINAIPKILPSIDIMLYCEYNCDPINSSSWCNECLDQFTPCTVETEAREIDLISVPFGINNEQLLGSVEKNNIYSEENEVKFIPGLIAKAHRNILYLRDISSRQPHIVNNIFDISSTGWNRIYINGSLIEHPARFFLIGTVHPNKEKNCREIIETFPLAVNFENHPNSDVLKETIKRCISFQEDPEAFSLDFIKKNSEIKKLIIDAGIYLETVTISKLQINNIIEGCIAKKIDGYKPVILLIKTAITYAAFEFKAAVEKKHIIQAARFTLGHITRDNGTLEPLSHDEISAMFEYEEISDPEVFERDYDVSKSMFNITEIFQPYDGEIKF